MQSLSSLTPIVDNIFDKYNNKNLVPIRSLSDHDIGISIFVNKPPQNLVFELGARIQINTLYEYNSVYIMHT